MTPNDFKSRFAKRIVQEFEASEQTAENIATMAAKYKENTRDEKSVDDWINWMKRGQRDALNRWNYAIGMVAGDYYNIGDKEGRDNPYQL